MFEYINVKSEAIIIINNIFILILKKNVLEKIFYNSHIYYTMLK